MKKIGIVRKIDDLGRIVIPKEIRNTLKIRTGNDIEINVIDEKIVLNKIDSFKTNNVLESIINIFSKNYHTNILLTSCEEIKLYHLINKNRIICNKLDEEIISIIDDRQKVRITKNSLLTNQNDFLVFPLIINGDLKGSIIIDYNCYFEKNININLLADILKIYLE